MNKSEINPPKNKLHEGLNEEELIRSITTSGFPLQGVVANLLKSNYGVTEEWSYIDRDSEGLRSLDVFAFRKLTSSETITPYTVMLIECKSSVHPYVFFQNSVKRSFPFPTICGLRPVKIQQRVGRENTSQECKAANILGLDDTTFGKTPPICSAFTQAIAKGNKVHVSGTDPFNSIVMPLVKATDHAMSLYGTLPSNQDKKLFPTLILNICVIDAPMIVVGNPDNGQSVRLEPWVRILRQEAKPNRNYIRYEHYVVDVVHRGYLKPFFNTRIEEFFDMYQKRVCEKSDIFRSGGVVDNLDSWIWKDVANA